MYRHPPHRASQRHARHSRPGRDAEPAGDLGLADTGGEQFGGAQSAPWS
jgi:hypothetical protein